jgi:HlyD family secretion protein
VLRKIDFKVGDNITSDEQKYIYIENPNLIQITVTVDQLDVVKLRVWQDAKIIFDSYPNVTFDGKVSEINSTPLETSGVTSYEITVTMDKGNHDIFSGMTAKVNIIVEKKKDVLYVPASFIQKRRWRAIVLKEDLSDPTGSGIITPVVTGISNLLNTEIVSGVKEWDTIIRKIATSTGSTQAGGLIPWIGGGGNKQWGWNTTGGGTRKFGG